MESRQTDLDYWRGQTQERLVYVERALKELRIEVEHSQATLTAVIESRLSKHQEEMRIMNVFINRLIGAVIVTSFLAPYVLPKLFALFAVPAGKP